MKVLNEKCLMKLLCLLLGSCLHSQRTHRKLWKESDLHTHSHKHKVIFIKEHSIKLDFKIDYCIKKLNKN